jgi:hypothetical protein
MITASYSDRDCQSAGRRVDVLADIQDHRSNGSKGLLFGVAKLRHHICPSYYETGRLNFWPPRITISYSLV